MFKQIMLFSLGLVLMTAAVASDDDHVLNASERARLCRCVPGDQCWPNAKSWKGLQGKLLSRLTPFDLPSEQGIPISGYILEAQTAKDIATTLKFARNHKLKLASNDSLTTDGLVIDTKKLRSITIEPAFTPKGCLMSEYRLPAVTIGAGASWLDAFNEVATKQHRYIQGAGFSSTGTIDHFTQSGGLSGFTKKFGTSAANVLQVEVVTANGDVVIANNCENTDLFWAIRGGGARTFGIVTSMTFATYPLPTSAGVFKATVTAKTDAAYHILLEQYLVFFRQYLNNDHWGDKFTFNKNNQINIALLFRDLDEQELVKTWQPFQEWIAKNESVYSMQSEVVNIPADKLWNKAFLEKKFPEIAATNENTVFFQSWWLPLHLFEDENIKSLSNMIFKASRVSDVSFQIDKGLAGSTIDAMQRTSNTATNPNVLQAAALIVMSTDDVDQINHINQAMSAFKNAAPNAGTYLNTADYVAKNWQTVFWGTNYPRLLEIKNKYDLAGMFYCEQCVGSEKWQKGGVCLANA